MSLSSTYLFLSKQLGVISFMIIMLAIIAFSAMFVITELCTYFIVTSNNNISAANTSNNVLEFQEVTYGISILLHFTSYIVLIFYTFKYREKIKLECPNWCFADSLPSLSFNLCKLIILAMLLLLMIVLSLAIPIVGGLRDAEHINTTVIEVRMEENLVIIIPIHTIFKVTV